MSEHPWTPAPWIFEGPDVYADCRVYHRRAGDDRDREPIWGDTNEANGRLIALAPEMAEAIIEAARHVRTRTPLHSKPSKVWTTILDLDERLRAIGGGS